MDDTVKASIFDDMYNRLSTLLDEIIDLNRQIRTRDAELHQLKSILNLMLSVDEVKKKFKQDNPGWSQTSTSISDDDALVPSFPDPEKERVCLDQ